MQGQRAGIARKAAVVAEIAERWGRSQAVILTDFRGLNVAATNRLRRRLREAGAEYVVAKNTLIRRAVAGAGAAFSGGLLEGPTGLCFAYQDPVAVAKALAEFSREFPALRLKGGWLRGRVVNADDVQLLSQLPAREVLIARVLGGMQAPISALAWVLTGTVRQLVQVLDAVRRQKEQAVAGQGAAS